MKNSQAKQTKQKQKRQIRQEIENGKIVSLEGTTSVEIEDLDSSQGSSNQETELQNKLNCSSQALSGKILGHQTPVDSSQNQNEQHLPGQQINLQSQNYQAPQHQQQLTGSFGLIKNGSRQSQQDDSCHTELMEVLSCNTGAQQDQQTKANAPLRIQKEIRQALKDHPLSPNIIGIKNLPKQDKVIKSEVFSEGTLRMFKSQLQNNLGGQQHLVIEEKIASNKVDDSYEKFVENSKRLNQTNEADVQSDSLESQILIKTEVLATNGVENTSYDQSSFDHNQKENTTQPFKAKIGRFTLIKQSTLNEPSIHTPHKLNTQQISMTPDQLQGIRMNSVNIQQPLSPNTLLLKHQKSESFEDQDRTSASRRNYQNTSQRNLSQIENQSECTNPQNLMTDDWQVKQNISGHSHLAAVNKTGEKSPEQINYELNQVNQSQSPTTIAYLQPLNDSDRKLRDTNENKGHQICESQGYFQQEQIVTDQKLVNGVLNQQYGNFTKRNSFTNSSKQSQSSDQSSKRTKSLDSQIDGYNEDFDQNENQRKVNSKSRINQSQENTNQSNSSSESRNSSSMNVPSKSFSPQYSIDRNGELSRDKMIHLNKSHSSQSTSSQGEKRSQSYVDGEKADEEAEKQIQQMKSANLLKLLPVVHPNGHPSVAGKQSYGTNKAKDQTIPIEEVNEEDGDGDEHDESKQNMVKSRGQGLDWQGDASENSAERDNLIEVKGNNSRVSSHKSSAQSDGYYQRQQRFNQPTNFYQGGGDSAMVNQSGTIGDQGNNQRSNQSDSIASDQSDGQPSVDKQAYQSSFKDPESSNQRLNANTQGEILYSDSFQSQTSQDDEEQRINDDVEQTSRSSSARSYKSNPSSFSSDQSSPDQEGKLSNLPVQDQMQQMQIELNKNLSQSFDQKTEDVQSPLIRLNKKFGQKISTQKNGIFGSTILDTPKRLEVLADFQSHTVVTPRLVHELNSQSSIEKSIQQEDKVGRTTDGQPNEEQQEEIRSPEDVQSNKNSKIYILEQAVEKNDSYKSNSLANQEFTFVNGKMVVDSNFSEKCSTDMDHAQIEQKVIDEVNQSDQQSLKSQERANMKFDNLLTNCNQIVLRKNRKGDKVIFNKSDFIISQQLAGNQLFLKMQDLKQKGLEYFAQVNLENQDSQANLLYVDQVSNIPTSVEEIKGRFKVKETCSIENPVRQRNQKKNRTEYLGKLKFSNKKRSSQLYKRTQTAPKNIEEDLHNQGYQEDDSDKMERINTELLNVSLEAKDQSSTESISGASPEEKKSTGRFKITLKKSKLSNTGSSPFMSSVHKLNFNECQTKNSEKQASIQQEAQCPIRQNKKTTPNTQTSHRFLNPHEKLHHSPECIFENLINHNHQLVSFGNSHYAHPTLQHGPFLHSSYSGSHQAYPSCYQCHNIQQQNLFFQHQQQQQQQLAHMMMLMQANQTHLVYPPVHPSHLYFPFQHYNHQHPHQPQNCCSGAASNQSCQRCLNQVNLSHQNCHASHGHNVVFSQGKPGRNPEQRHRGVRHQVMTDFGQTHSMPCEHVVQQASACRCQCTAPPSSHLHPRNSEYSSSHQSTNSHEHPQSKNASQIQKRGIDRSKFRNQNNLHKQNKEQQLNEKLKETQKGEDRVQIGKKKPQMHQIQEESSSEQESSFYSSQNIKSCQSSGYNSSKTSKKISMNRKMSELTDKMNLLVDSQHQFMQSIQSLLLMQSAAMLQQPHANQQQHQNPNTLLQSIVTEAPYRTNGYQMFAAKQNHGMDENLNMGHDTNTVAQTNMADLLLQGQTNQVVNEHGEDVHDVIESPGSYAKVVTRLRLNKNNHQSSTAAGSTPQMMNNIHSSICNDE